MKIYLLAAALLISSLSFASENDWGRTGHRATGEVAEQHLTKKAKQKVREILDGQNLAFVSTYGDDIKSDPAYRKYNVWHYVNLEPGETEYSKEKANPDGDLVQAIKTCMAVLKDKDASKEEKAFFLKMLVHFVGDLHQPLHAGRGEDKGGNDIQIRWFGQGSNLHRLWDSEMINDFQMSYTELAHNSDELSKEEIKKIQAGSVLDWMYESKALANKVYDSVEVGEKLGYEYMYEWFPVVHDQLQKGGLRLARILNEIFA
ncbi:S1/P1 nuclease [Salinimicrobium oceani]|uniref:S1/P1 nuclease n=1 Tax=Salinimicrobium oceani TaxID=2722702 RepID=A0ABX1CV16_9FLAO|nr:S1/P1 nuclease [Salinimicrobium oceani]NJW51735.1 S1/P1 nuclease [Salinimicrobium oceani]